MSAGEHNGMHHHGPASTPDAAIEGPLASGERLRPVALAGITVGLLALCAALSIPFLPALVWAVALAIIAWPLHAWLATRTDRRSLAAVITSAVVVLVIVVPALFVAYRLGREAGTAVDAAGNTNPDAVVRDQATKTPGLDRVVVWMDKAGVDINNEVRKLVSGYFGNFSGMLEGSLAALVQAAVALYVLYFLLRDRDVFIGGVRGLLPMTRSECDRVFQSFADSVHANLYASVVTSAINGAVGGALFWLLGLPSPTLWGVVIFVLSIVPVLGVFLVWVPAAVYMLLTGNYLGAGALIAWGVLSAIIVDTFLYVRLAGGRMRMHSVPTFIAFLGGLALFGASGIILGPAALAVTVAVLKAWERRGDAATEAQPEPSKQRSPVMS